MEECKQLISVIVPVYNGQAYLDRCVQSILGQTYEKLEVLLIDGGSTDHTAALCRRYCQTDQRVRFLQESENRGVSYSRNHGLREARGEYLTFVDADDWLLPDCMERLVRDLQETGAQIAGCSFMSCREESDAAGHGQSVIRRVVIPGERFLQEGILRRDTRCWSKLYRAESIRGCLFREDYAIGEDMLFVWETSKRASLISSSSYEGYCYFRNPGGAMLRPFRESDMDQIRCWQEVLECVRQDPGTAEDTVAEVATILLVSCMLVAGKLALLPGRQRRQLCRFRERCQGVVKKTLRIRGSYQGLDGGYRLKVALFSRMPRTYMVLYHVLKWRENHDHCKSDGRAG